MSDFKRNKPHVNVGTIGGGSLLLKSTVTAAVAKAANMMTSTNKRDGGEGELLPLPTGTCAHDLPGEREVFSYAEMQAYARANVERALAESRAECRKWREKYEDAWAEVGAQSEARAFAEARAERLTRAGRRVTAAFRALGCKLGFTELVEARHECEAAILALDAALEQEPQE